MVLRYNSRRSASLFPLYTRARFAAAARVGSVGSVGSCLASLSLLTSTASTDRPRPQSNTEDPP